jgi:uncharacterized PurR-regulated membrane protein YhhQ (DUF165 family)
MHFDAHIVSLSIIAVGGLALVVGAFTTKWPARWPKVVLLLSAVLVVSDIAFALCLRHLDAHNRWFESLSHAKSILVGLVAGLLLAFLLASVLDFRPAKRASRQ